MQIQQLYADVSAKIIAELDAGAVPWLKAWKGSNTGLVPQTQSLRHQIRIFEGPSHLACFEPAVTEPSPPEPS